MPARRISMTVKLAVVFVGIALLLVFGFRRLLFHKIYDSEDDRPPIIVHNGSLLFDHAKHWKKDTSGPNRFKPDHPRGHSVASYDVVLTGSSTAACTGTTLNGLEVFIDYRADATTPAKQFHLYRKLTFTTPATVKREPALDSPEPLTIVPTAPTRLVYPVGPDGWISNVTIGTTSCAFAQPATPADRLLVRVDITPKV